MPVATISSEDLIGSRIELASVEPERGASARQPNGAKERRDLKRRIGAGSIISVEGDGPGWGSGPGGGLQGNAQSRDAVHAHAAFQSGHRNGRSTARVPVCDQVKRVHRSQA